MKNTQRLLDIMALLRDKEKGCPWDIEQDFKSIVPHTLEEAYEVADAIEKNDMQSLREELGDLLLQIVFYAQMANEEKLFDFEDIAAAINQKLISRHPHVFGDADIKTADEQVAAWEKMKAAERGETKGALEGVPLALPALTRAVKLQKRAARVGFDWPTVEPVFDKLQEEIGELKEAAEEKIPDHIKEELGDILFACANLARHFKIEPEEALRAANQKFERRFRYIERQLAARNRTPEQSTLEEMDALWNEAKKKPETF